MNFQTVDYMYWAKTASADCDLLLSVSASLLNCCMLHGTFLNYYSK